jgi:hypothetical protein
MANPNRPNGLVPVKHITGAPYNGQGNIYCILAANTSGFAIGDPVISGGSADANGVPNIALYGGTGAIRGVIMGLGTSEAGLFNPSNLDSTVRPAAAQATNWYALVADSPDLIFEVQEHSNGTQLAATEVGLNQILLSGTNNGFVSGWLLSSVTDATPATTATLAFRLLGLARRADNAYGAYAKWLVYANVHELGHGTGAAGV